MTQGTNVEKRILTRIAGSANSLVVHYPESRPVITGSTPQAGPVNPLTGPAPTTTVYPTDPVPILPPITVQCLWLDSFKSMGKTKNNLTVENVGWRQGTDAVARVSIKDTALDETDPFGDTIFTGAEFVEFSGQRYDVVQVEPIAASFRAPVTYHVWMKGSVKHVV